MNNRAIRKILKDTDFIHTSGTAEELKVAEYLKDQCEAMGVKAWLESFPVAMATMEDAHLYADGKEIPCEGYRLCGSGEVEAPLVYLPDTDPASLTKAKDSIVLLDGGVRYFVYHDLLEAGAVGIITYDGNVFYRDRDIDKKELRPHVVDGAKKLLCASVNAKDAFALVKSGAKTAKIIVKQEEYEGASHNVVAELPGLTDEWIVLTAHYDTVPLSRGSYDNMTGCIGLLNTLDALKGEQHRYGLRFVFCGSEERGLLGSKAYVRDHEPELNKIALNINLDMIGTYMGHFIARVSAEDALVNYIKYLGAELGFGIAPRQGVYSSDSTPFADKGVPALSFARIAGPSQAVIHNRYDTPDVLSDDRIRTDSIFITAFTRRMANAVKCPVKREIPEKVKNELDEYLFRNGRTIDQTAFDPITFQRSSRFMPLIRLIATDVDGTLLNSQLKIPDRNLRAIHAAQEKGITVAISSGRFPENVYVLLQDYGLRCPIIGTNGADVIDEKLNRLSETCIAPDAALRALHELIRLGADYFMFARQAICTSRETRRHHSELSFGDRIRALGFTYYHGPDEALLLAGQGIAHKFFVCDNVDLDRVRESLDGIPGIELTQSSANNIEVMPCGVDKGIGVQTLADTLGIPMEQVMTLGDEENDIPMLRAAGYGIAMANGSAEAKAAAKYVTDTNEECGFAKAIEKFAL